MGGRIIQLDHDGGLAILLKLYDVIYLSNAVVLIGSNKAEYEHLAASEWYLWKIIEK